MHGRKHLKSFVTRKYIVTPTLHTQRPDDPMANQDVEKKIFSTCSDTIIIIFFKERSRSYISSSIVFVFANSSEVSIYGPRYLTEESCMGQKKKIKIAYIGSHTRTRTHRVRVSQQGS